MLLVFLLLAQSLLENAPGILLGNGGGGTVGKPQGTARMGAGAQLLPDFLQSVRGIPASAEAPFHIGKIVFAALSLAAPAPPLLSAGVHFREHRVFQPLGLKHIGLALGQKPKPLRKLPVLSPRLHPGKAEIGFQKLQNILSQCLRLQICPLPDFRIELCLLGKEHPRRVTQSLPPVGSLQGFAQQGFSHIFRSGTAFQAVQKKVCIVPAQVFQGRTQRQISPVYRLLDKQPGEPVIGSLPDVPLPGVKQSLQGLLAEEFLRKTRYGVHVQGIGNEHRLKAVLPCPVPHLIQSPPSGGTELLRIHRSKTCSRRSFPGIRAAITSRMSCCS